MKLTQVLFTNINGEPLGTIAPPKKNSPKREPKDKYHDGWRVVGFPPGAIEAAKEQHEQDIADIELRNETLLPSARAKIPPPWNEHRWLSTTRKKPVRAKPYEVPEAAAECMALAVRFGWLHVEIVELKKRKSA